MQRNLYQDFDQNKRPLDQSDLGDISDEMISIEDTYKETGLSKKNQESNCFSDDECNQKE